MKLLRSLGVLLALVGCGGSPQPSVAANPVQIQTRPAEPARERFFDASARYGTAHPFFGVATDPHGRWSAFCQAREDTNGDGEVRAWTCGYHGELCGDERDLYLASRFNAEGEALQGFVGASLDGDFVAYTSARGLVVRHMESGAETLLGQDVPTDDNPSMGSRALSFGDGVATYLRGDEELVLRNLEDGTEQVVPVTSGRVWRAFPVGGGSFLMLALVEADTNGNGTLDLPQVHTSLSAGPCRGHVSSYSRGGYTGDDWTRKIVRASTGEIIADDDTLIAAQGDAIITRRGDGAIEWISAEERVLAIPASCGARVLGAWEQRILAVCAADGAPTSVAIYEGGRRHDLGIEDGATANYAEVLTDTRFLPMESAVGGQQLVDMEQRRAFPRPYGGTHGVRGDSGLRVIEGGAMELHNYVTGSTVEVVGSSEDYPRGRQFTPRWSVVEIADRETLVDLEDGHIEGTFPSRPLAMHPSGYALLSRNSDDGDTMGPLTWQRPEPVIETSSPR